jgi:hypothetical protein
MVRVTLEGGMTRGLGAVEGLSVMMNLLLADKVPFMTIYQQLNK